MKRFYLILLSFFVAVTIGSFFYYQHLISKLPSQIAESRERIVSVDKIRFTFKIASLSEKALSTYLYGCTTKDEALVYEALDYLDASYAFMDIEYTKNQNLVEYVKPRLQESSAIIENGRLNPDTQDIAHLKVLIHEISDRAEVEEKNTWKNIQDEYISYIKSEYTIKAILEVALFLIISLIFIIFLLNRYINDNQKKALEKLQKLIDIQHEIVILTDGQKLIFANQVFLDFFGVTSVEEFKKAYNCICQKFINDDHFFHLGKVKPTERNWLESILNLPGRERIVSIQDVHGSKYAFSVSISLYEENNYIVDFHDVSDVMLEKLNLVKQAIHDQLTKSYNRTYYEHNINRLLEQNDKVQKYTGIIMLDIDHFKDVNDTYGHDVGDKVLVDVYQLIKRSSRESDKIIRWGGEEFLIIMPVNSLSDVTKRAENIRSTIEHTNFDPVKKLTCSFGGTLYDGHTDIDSVIKKADENLYRAKNDGRNKVVAEGINEG